MEPVDRDEISERNIRGGQNLLLWHLKDHLLWTSLNSRRRKDHRWRLRLLRLLLLLLLLHRRPGEFCPEWVRVLRSGRRQDGMSR